MNYFKKNVLLSFVVLALFSTACNREFLDTDAEKATQENEAAILAYLQNNNLSGFTKTASAIHYKVTTQNPAGALVELGDQARIYYKWTLLNGSIIDTVLTGTPLSFAVYNGFSFPGFLEAITLLKEGEKGTFLIPASQAFQSQSSADIPAWSAMKIDMEILSFRSEGEQITAYVAQKGFEDVQISSTGLRFIPQAVASGGTPLANGDQVVVKYRGATLDDTQFDAGEFNLTLGSNGSIAGFEEGVKMMKVGDKATIIFPSSIGYGANGTRDQQGRQVIFPYSPLLFELEILSKR